MKGPRYVYTARGAGLTFAVAAALFAFTLQPLYLALPIVGALAGLALGTAVERRSTMQPQDAGTAAATSATRSLPARVLQHQSLIVRFAGLLAIAALLFVAAWYAGYHLLPEGVLRSKNAAAAAVGGTVAPNVLMEWLPMVLWNVGVGCGLVVLGNIALRINGYPLGYLAPLVNVVIYGLVIGSNSFAIPMAQRLAPSLAVLERAGPYEFAAYLLVAAATASLSRWEIKRFMRTNPERVLPPPRLALTAGQWAAVGLALALILLAAWREAVMVLAR